MRILSLDISLKTGWALHQDASLLDCGLIRVEIRDFNVNDDPNKQGSYPYNILEAAKSVAERLIGLISEKNPDSIVVENTVKGRNRHTQRLLEWIHMAVVESIRLKGWSFHYLDPSEWRSALAMRLSKDDKKNNRLVGQGKKRGRITKKHLSVRMANDLYGLKLKIKDNDIADAICLGRAFYERSQS